jgi:hypothetical protein
VAIDWRGATASLSQEELRSRISALRQDSRFDSRVFDDEQFVEMMVVGGAMAALRLYGPPNEIDEHWEAACAAAECVPMPSPVESHAKEFLDYLSAIALALHRAVDALEEHQALQINLRSRTIEDSGGYRPKLTVAVAEYIQGAKLTPPIDLLFLEEVSEALRAFFSPPFGPSGSALSPRWGGRIHLDLKAELERRGL